MKFSWYASRFLFAVLLLSTGLACNLGSAASAVTPTSSPQPIILPDTPTTAPIQPSATTAPTAMPQVVQNSNSQANTTTYSSAPVILLLAGAGGTLGDIYTWDVATQSLKQLTTWGYNFAPHISANGQWLAYLSVSQAGVTALQSGAMNPQVYANIWLFNPYTQDAIRIADQPANATLASGNLIRRTTEPVWSPDGGSVAWVESDTQGERLAIYSVTAKSAAMYPLNLPAICCEGASRTIYWGHSGIAVSGNEGTFNQPQQAIYIFSPQGQQIAKTILATDTYLEYGWALDANNHEYLAGVTNGEFTLVDPFNNSGNSLPAYPELYSVTAPTDLAIRPAKNPVLWTVTRQNQNVTDLSNVTDVRHMSIAPDGHSVVYLQGDSVQGGSAFVYLANGQTIPIISQKRLLAITWGATSWRIHAGA